MSNINRAQIKETAKSYLKAPFLNGLMLTMGIYLLIGTFGGMIPMVGGLAGIFAFILYKNIERYNYEVRVYNTPLLTKRIFDFDGIGKFILGRLWAMLKMWPAYVSLIVGFIIMLSSAFFMGLGAGMSEAGSEGAEVFAIISLLVMIFGYFVVMGSLVLTIILSFNYVLTEFILMDNPNMNPKDAADLSKQMMKGHKGEWFVMTLSFIGWDILTGFTFGILSIYTMPYKLQTFLGYYFVYRDNFKQLNNNNVV